MRRLLVVGLLIALAALTGCSGSQAGRYAPLPKVGAAKIDVDTPALRKAKRAAGIAACRPGTGRNDLPAVTLPCFGGGPAVALDKLPGPLVLNVWASWCGPCRAELPIYQRLSAALAGRATVLGVDYQDPQSDQAMRLLTEQGATYPQVADPQQLLRSTSPRLLTTGLPVLVLVDRAGSIVYQAPGGIQSYAEVRKLVSTHLGLG